MAPARMRGDGWTMAPRTRYSTQSGQTHRAPDAGSGGWGDHPSSHLHLLLRSVHDAYCCDLQMMGAKNMLRRLMGEVGEKARGVKWGEDEWKGGRHLKY
uniref:Uncharacterized protein n=1 Tax=Oryza rufipogon TaxID=4529 RepID=A0A0E0PYC0_ORYRU